MQTVFEDEWLSGAIIKRSALARCLRTLQAGDMLTL
jgi:hypothetical protein